MLAIAADMALRGYRQRMWVMRLVYPITALRWGPAKLPGWVTSVKAIRHCGAECMLGGISSECSYGRAACRSRASPCTPTSFSTS